MDKTSKHSLSGADTAWLRMDAPTNLMVINAMLITERLPFPDFRKVVSTRFLKFSRFKSRPVFKTNQYFWEDDPLFDLDCHVKRVALPGDADKAELQQFVADQASIPFDESKPMWQIIFVENYAEGNAIILRVHHSYADGLALISVFHSITDESAVVSPTNSVLDLSLSPSNDDVSDEHDGGELRYQSLLSSAVGRVDYYQKLAGRVAKDGLQLLRNENTLRETLGDGVKALAEITKLAVMPADPQGVLKGQLGVRKSCAWSEPISLDRFHSIAKNVGCKINDLLLSCVAGALREELIHVGEEVDGRHVHVTVPVNIRPQDKQDLSRAPESLGNCFGTVIVALPIGIENPLERIYKIKHDMLALKESWQPALSYTVLTLAGMLPRHTQKALLETFSNKTSAVLSNVPGKRDIRYVAGARIKEQMFWVPQIGDIGLGLSIISYAGQVQFGLIGDAQLFPDPQSLVNRFIDQLDKHRGDIIASYIDDLVQPNVAS